MAELSTEGSLKREARALRGSKSRLVRARSRGDSFYYSGRYDRVTCVRMSFENELFSIRRDQSDRNVRESASRCAIYYLANSRRRDDSSVAAYNANMFDQAASDLEEKPLSMAAEDFLANLSGRRSTRRVVAIR